MLKIIGLSQKPCFLTGSRDHVVDVKFADGSFLGALSWASLLDVIKRKAQEAEQAKKESESGTNQTAQDAQTAPKS